MILEADLDGDGLISYQGTFVHFLVLIGKSSENNKRLVTSKTFCYI